MLLTTKYIDAASKHKKTPYLLLDTEQVSKNYNRLSNALPSTKIHYSVKSNNMLELVNHLHNIGSYFDVATYAEIKLTKKLGISPNKLVFSTPIKKEDEIKKAYLHGVRRFAFDSMEELNKFKKVAPEAKLILRILVDSKGSQCPMFKKFGVYIDEALKYLIQAKKVGLQPIGLTFHVGSQCLTPSNWAKALKRAGTVWNQAKKAGIYLHLVNLGGGLPVQYSKPVDPIEKHTKVIQNELSNNFDGLTETYIEPGRYMTDKAGVMVATIIGKARKNSTNWIFLDVGGFNGLFEIFEGFKYDIKTLKDSGEKVDYAVGGPTCDGLDIIRKKISLPKKLEVNDKVFIMNAGAYSVSKERYNGLKWARSFTISK